jgi:hypothetical protein
MKPDTVLRVEAMNVLIKNLGEVDAERFIGVFQKKANFVDTTTKQAKRAYYSLG